MNKEIYQFYTVEEFLADRDFIRYVKFHSPDDVLFWENWSAENPDRLVTFQEAYSELKIIFSDPGIVVPHGFMEKLRMDINSSIDQVEAKRKRAKSYILWSSSIAASLVVGILSVWYFTSNIIVLTNYGETKKIQFSDGTEILLNANSTLSYPRAYAWKKVRSISLDGEAYFKVKHINQNPLSIKSGELFQAKTKSIEVSVLGTEFNLKERHNLANVALVNGKVKVRSIKTNIGYFLQPGNTIKINSTNGQLMPNQYGSLEQTAWIDGKLIVNQATVNEIITAFEDLYGYKVILDNPALGNKKIDGSISIKSEQSLLFTLSNILNVNIKKEGKTIRLETRR
ncbi:FecR family protein [Pedobacter sp. N23S346]|uniref:FecR family protein n=1 Tax=Pedobacter sp. N23S346 TaxID=3402750 RepID=UPI003AC7ACFB